MSVLSVIGPALGAGILHVILGPDHIAAIITVSACQGTAAMWYGLRWGIGHSLGLVIVALVMWMVDADTDVSNEEFARYASYFSGVFMILFGSYFIRDILLHDKSGLGFSALSTSTDTEMVDVIGAPRRAEPDSAMDDEFQLETEDKSPSSSSSQNDDSKARKVTWKQALASLCAGVVGGIAGPGGVLAIVPASYYSTKIEAISYILIFIISSTAAMGLIALLYGRMTARWAMNSLNKQRQETQLKLASAIASILVGALWIVLTACNVLDLH